MSDTETRLRSHPQQRFAGDSHVFDLGRALAELRAEAHEAPDEAALLHRRRVIRAGIERVKPAAGSQEGCQS